MWGGDSVYLDLGAETTKFDTLSALFFDNTEFHEIIHSMEYKVN